MNLDVPGPLTPRGPVPGWSAAILLAIGSLATVRSPAQVEPESPDRVAESERIAVLRGIRRAAVAGDLDLALSRFVSLDESGSWSGGGLWVLASVALGSHPRGVSSAALDLLLKHTAPGTPEGAIADAARQVRDREPELVIACMWGDEDRVRRLLQEGVGPDLRFGLLAHIGAKAIFQAPLTAAVLHGHEDVVRTLLAAGADPDAAGFRLSPLEAAIGVDRWEMVYHLKQHGAAGDVRTIADRHALLSAACQGYPGEPSGAYPPWPGVPVYKGYKTLESLVETVASLDGVNPDGHTALMFAAGLGLERNVVLLVRAGADTWRRNRLGQTALDLAVRNGRDGVVRRLRRAMAVQRVAWAAYFLLRP